MSVDQQWKSLVRLRQILSSRFDMDELRTLCFDLGVDFDDLPVQGKSNKARELVGHLARRNQISHLISVGQELRPDIPWADFAAAGLASAAVDEQLIDNLHEKRVDLLSELFAQIVELGDQLRAWAYKDMPIGIAPETVEMAVVIEEIRELRRMAKKASIYLGADMRLLLDRVVEEIAATAQELERRELIPDEETQWSSHVSALDRLFDTLPEAVERLEAQIRGLLGV
jgi:hypothetical protein